LASNSMLVTTNSVPPSFFKASLKTARSATQRC
jgi:hypothetical protein